MLNSEEKNAHGLPEQDEQVNMPEPETPATPPAPEIDPEQSEAEKLRQEYDALNDRYLRLVAEYDNYRKRTQKERDDIYPNATAAALTPFLPVLDNLDRAEQFAPDTEEFKKGFDMICKSIREIMAGMGVEEIGQEGEPFDPQMHHAVMHIEDEELGENVVSQVLQKGYKMGGRILRCAMVQTAN